MTEPETVFGVGPRDAGKRLDRFLNERIPGLSRTRIQEAIRRRVTLSWGVAARPSTPVRPGGSVIVTTVPLVEPPLELTIAILAEGPGWLAVDKPAGIPVHPVNRERDNTVIRMLRKQVGDEELRLCHRLDRETTGVLLVARDAATARALSTAFERGKVTKEYLALVAGEVEAPEGTIDLPIAEAASRVYTRRETSEAGESALTVWRVERRLPGRTLLRVFPKTGRRHQIRVHLAAIGHPIVGDLLYGRADADFLDVVAGRGDARHAEGGPRRQMLHNARLAIGEHGVDVSAPLPADFEAELA
jgi:23S rRNA pseudouridine1911/1915/1917 synthase